MPPVGNSALTGKLTIAGIQVSTFKYDDSVDLAAVCESLLRFTRAHGRPEADHVTGVVVAHPVIIMICANI